MEKGIYSCGEYLGQREICVVHSADNKKILPLWRDAIRYVLTRKLFFFLMLFFL